MAIFLFLPNAHPTVFSMTKQKSGFTNHGSRDTPALSRRPSRAHNAIPRSAAQPRRAQPLEYSIEQATPENDSPGALPHKLHDALPTAPLQALPRLDAEA